MLSKSAPMDVAVRIWDAYFVYGDCFLYRMALGLCSYIGVYVIVNVYSSQSLYGICMSVIGYAKKKAHIYSELGVHYIDYLHLRNQGLSKCTAHSSSASTLRQVHCCVLWYQPPCIFMCGTRHNHMHAIVRIIAHVIRWIESRYRVLAANQRLDRYSFLQPPLS